MKNRFYRNQTNTDCAPIAILNALRWLGYPVNMRNDYRNLCIACCCSGQGTTHAQITRVLRICTKFFPGLKLFQPRKLSGRRIAEFLNGHKTTVLYSYRLPRRKRGHIYTIVSGRKGRGFINLFKKPVVYWTKKKPPTQVLKCKNGFPAAWVLERVK